MKKALILISITLISMNSLYARDKSPSHPAPDQPEILMGVLTNNHGITFQTASCGKKTLFRVSIMESFPPQLRLLRRSDMVECNQVFTHGQAIFFSYRELGIDGNAFSIVNEINPGPLQ